MKWNLQIFSVPVLRKQLLASDSLNLETGHCINNIKNVKIYLTCQRWKQTQTNVCNQLY